MLTPEPHISLCKAHMLAPDGHCKTFDAAADGVCAHEGVQLLKFSNGSRMHKPMATGFSRLDSRIGRKP